jgi:ribosomal protein S18 acetylase RimI-like enzyme
MRPSPGADPEAVAIRSASKADATAIAELYREAAAEALEREPTHFRLPDLEAIRRRFADMIGSGEGRILVAEEGGDVVGFVDARLRPPVPDGVMLAPRAGVYVEELAVRNGHRGRGVGRRLMDEVERWCRAQGGAVVMLDTGVRNEAAQRFYDRLGYRTIGVVLVKEWTNDRA